MFPPLLSGSDPRLVFLQKVPWRNALPMTRMVICCAY